MMEKQVIMSTSSVGREVGRQMDGFREVKEWQRLSIVTSSSSSFTGVTTHYGF
jgi:hypothetical protein